MGVRLAAIANYSGVSESTVSRVLTGKPGVAESTRASVLTALDVLGYERPTQLRDQRIRVAGIVVPELRNPIFPSFAESIGTVLAQRGFTPMVCVTEAGGKPEAEYVEMLLERRVSGVIFVSGLHAVAKQDLGHYRRLLERGLPVVVVNGVVEDLAVTAVSTDDRTAVELAVRHLVSLGHRTIGLSISDDEHIPGHRKAASFLEVVRDLLGVDEASALIDRSMYSLEGGLAAATRLIKRGATGIVCASDLMALGAVRAAQRLELEVPRDISVIGYDDSAFMPLVCPPMTTIRQPIEAISRAAASLLLAQIGGADARHEEILFEPELVVRGSTGPSANSKATDSLE
jgi:LacI family transcriptional regulator, repressor for deo operon, udp, cdd, tsx, nupC, and nupG